MTEFNPIWRAEKSAAFDLKTNSTAGRTVHLNFWGNTRPVYANANFSVYSAQKCNARCPFCVEELRPSSRGRELTAQKTVEQNEELYFSRLRESLEVLRPLNPSVSMTGGEISKDPRLPRLLRLLAAEGARQKTLTTNGSGLLDEREGARVIDWITQTGVRHLNISIAHHDPGRNQKIMRFKEGLTSAELKQVNAIAQQGGVGMRLSCVLLNGEIDSLPAIENYLQFAEQTGVRDVIFRQLMKTDPENHLLNYVIRYSDSKRTRLQPLLDQISTHPGFTFQKQIVGYYYYVEVWKYRGINVVFEEADLARLEQTKKLDPAVVHELIFHPNTALASTWQPWDNVLSPWREEGVLSRV